MESERSDVSIELPAGEKKGGVGGALVERGREVTKWERREGAKRKEEVLTTVDLDVDVLNLEDARLVVRLLVREDEGDRGAETLTTENDVSEARVLHLRQTRLLAVVEGDVAHVGLNL